MGIIIGIDEVGRGCWAGPLVAAAVILTRSIPGLKDSKLLTRTERENLASQIYDNGKVGIGWVMPEEIDGVGLTAAISMAMKKATDQFVGTYDEIIIDGNYNYLKDLPNTRPVIKADTYIPAVSAAGIVAKVARDQYMKEAASTYPEYGFEYHVGYGTSMHIESLKKHGPCALHRLSYKPIKALIGVN